ncbi:MAG TPA: glycosyltransferase family 2 protein [candidate division UBP10 bacterium]|nr:glycosyltransferase family 2 protein [Candidatus Binatota bacterium]
MIESSQTVAVVIPVRDRMQLLGRALDSVLAQLRPPDEIVVVDDGSVDGSADLVKQGYPGVKLLMQAPAGVSAARNRGIASSSSDWLAFLDSDDAWHPDKLQRQLTALSERPSMKICHCDEIWLRNGRRVNPMRKHARYGGWVFERCLPLCCISPSTALVHRDVFASVGVFDETLPACEDYDLWLRVSARFPVLYLDEKLATRWGGHADQLSARYPAMDRFRVKALEKVLLPGTLQPRWRRAAAAEARRRLDILAAGSERRGRVQEACAFRARAAELGRYQR